MIVIDANTFDLQGSAFANAYVSGGTFAPSDIEIAGNIIEDIDGTPNAVNSFNGNFGVGIYAVDLATGLIAGGGLIVVMMMTYGVKQSRTPRKRATQIF